MKKNYLLKLLVNVNNRRYMLQAGMLRVKCELSKNFHALDFLLGVNSCGQYRSDKTV